MAVTKERVVKTGGYASVGGGQAHGGSTSYLNNYSRPAATAAPTARPAAPAYAGPAPSYAGGGGAAAAPPPPPPAAASGAGGALTLHADTNQALSALSGRYGKHLDNLEGNTGHIMDTAASRIRDVREGGRRALQEDALFANKASDPGLASYEAGTSGLQAGAIADIAQGREANLTNALVGGVGVMGAPAEMALKEKGTQIAAYNAENAAKSAVSNMAFQQWMALLNANRTSPIYTG